MSTKILTTSSNLSVLSTLNHSTKYILNHIKIFKISCVDHITTLWRVLDRYLQSITKNEYDYCLFTPVLGIAPYMSRILRIPFFTHQVLIMVRRGFMTSPTSVEMILQDATTWIDKILKHRPSDSLSRRPEIRFMIYYDRETLWHILLHYIPIIITIDYKAVLNITKCREVYITQFTVYNAFKDLLIESKAETHIITPTPLHQDSKEMCNPLTCIDATTSSPYSFSNEIEFLQKFSHKNLEKVFIEFWSSTAYLDKNNYDYVWFFVPTVKDLTIAAKMLASRGTIPKIIKVVVVQDLFAELGAINSKRVWISLLLKSIVINSETKVIFI